MSSYRSAYENYYKNINNTEKRTKAKKIFSFIGKKNDDIHKPSYNIKENDSIKNFLIKRIISELTGATILLLFFVSIKYIPSVQINEIHSKCKQALNYNLNYNECIDEFNTIEIGNVKGKDLRIGNFSTEDLRIENLKLRAANFMEYIKNSENMQN